MIEERGLGSASALVGGFDAWQQAGYPIEAKSGSQVGAAR
jgi:rhodanese-related sulfurtransferase